MEYNANDFYNPNVKIAFLKSKEQSMKPQTILVYKRLFAAIKEDEEGYGMDLCDMKYDTLINVFNKKLSRSRASKHTQLSLLRNYVAWCISQKIKKSFDNPIQSIKSTDINSSIQIRTQFISSPEHLQEILDTVLESEKEESANGIMYRMTCWLLFEGFTEKEMLSLRKSDVDFEKNTISTPDGKKTIVMSDVLRELIAKAIEIKETVRSNTHGGVSVLPLEESDKLYRKIDRKDISHESQPLRTKLSALKKEYATNTYERVSISAKRLWLSGIFYRLYQKEKRGEMLTDEDFKFNITEEMSYPSVMAKINNNKYDYEEWKKAFNLI